MWETGIQTEKLWSDWHGLCTFVVEQGFRFFLSEPYVSYLHPPAQDQDVRNKLTSKNKSQI